MPIPERDYKRELYDSYKAERKDLNGTALTISERYDKNILYVGAGALAVSLTFLEKIAPNPRGWLFVILGASWACLVLSILAHLMALAYGQRAIRRQMEILDSDYSRYLHSEAPEDEIRKPGDTSNRFSERTGILSQLALWLVVVGVGLLCLFSVVSLTKEKGNRDVPKTDTTSTASTEATDRRDPGIVYPTSEFSSSSSAAASSSVDAKETLKRANKSPEPTTTAVTPRAGDPKSK